MYYAPRNVFENAIIEEFINRIKKKDFNSPDIFIKFNKSTFNVVQTILNKLTHVFGRIKLLCI